MNFDFNEAIEIAKRTWYPKDHPLHFNPHHPLGKLLGEWGELLDDYMKSLYKPGYEFEPLDELGDIWYYIRILCYQRDYEPEFVIFPPCKPDFIIAQAISQCASGFINQLDNIPYSPYILDMSYSVSEELCNDYNLTLDQLTESNWQKLKPGSERGEQWAKAREVIK